MKAVFLTHYYPPEAGAPQTRIAALAAGLTQRGWDVAVHTGFPHYPAGRVMAPYRNRPLLRERGPGGERVVRSAIYPTANRGFARRLANHLSLAGSSLATMPASGPADVVVAETPPLFLAGAAVGYAAAKRAPLVVNVADRWPASAVQIGALDDPRAIAAAEWLERWVYDRSAAVAVPTEGLARELEAEAPGKVHRLPPAVDLDRFAALPAARHEGPLRVLYAGTVGLAHGIATLLEAARLAGPEVVEVIVAGGGAEAALLERAPGNVRHAGILPAEAVPGLYAEADAGVVLLRDLPLFTGALPTKMLECLAAGRPVVLSARGEATALAREAGVVVAPEDPAALAAAFRELQADRARAAELGAAGRAVVEARFGRERSLDAWEDLLRLSASATTRRRPASGRRPRRRARR